MRKVLSTVGFVGLLGAGVVSGMGANCSTKKECKGVVEQVLGTYTDKKPLTITWFKKDFDVKDKDATKKLRSQLMTDNPRIITKEVAPNITFAGKEAVMITATYNKKKDVGIYVKEDVAPPDVKTVRKLADKYKQDEPLEVQGIGGKKAQEDDATKAILTALQAADPQFPPKGVSFKSEQLKVDTAATVTATYRGEATDFFVKAVA